MRPTIREFYNVRDLEAIDKIGTNHALSFIDEPYKSDVRLLQLSENTRLESLLELLSMKINSSGVELLQVSANYTIPESDRIDRLKTAVEKLTVQVSLLTSKGNPSSITTPVCEHCNKKWPIKSRCLKPMTCNKCLKRGHIAKFCTENTNPSSSTRYSDFILMEETTIMSQTLPKAPRIMIPISIFDSTYEFLYDPGSMFTMIPRSVYDK